MPSGSKKPAAAPAGPPPTSAELSDRHRAMAEELLARAAKADHRDAETRLAAMATAHATLATSYLVLDMYVKGKGSLSVLEAIPAGKTV